MRSRITVVKKFTFEACHHLVKYKGACERPHGHSYKLEIGVSGFPDYRGLVIDFKELKALVNDLIISKVDHYDLNDEMVKSFNMNGNTTCENMVQTFFEVLDSEITGMQPSLRLEFVKLWETEDSYAYLDRKEFNKYE